MAPLHMLLRAGRPGPHNAQRHPQQAVGQLLACARSALCNTPAKNRILNPHAMRLGREAGFQNCLEGATVCCNEPAPPKPGRPQSARRRPLATTCGPLTSKATKHIICLAGVRICSPHPPLDSQQGHVCRTPARHAIGQTRGSSTELRCRWRPPKPEAEDISATT